MQHNRRCYAASAVLGLSPYRLYYNGSVVDSGGGGQITLGGPSPRESPFFVVPQLLPRLVGYVERHPALSYLFAHDYTGPSGQSVRPDEHGADALSELRLALALLDRATAFDPAVLWRSLAFCHRSDAQGQVRVFGLRYRSFVAAIGLPPTLGTQVPLRLLLTHPARDDAFEITLREWNPAGEAYDGVPKDLTEAGELRAARCVVQRVAARDVPPAETAPLGSLSPCTLDLRYSP